MYENQWESKIFLLYLIKYFSNINSNHAHHHQEKRKWKNNLTNLNKLCTISITETQITSAKGQWLKRFHNKAVRWWSPPIVHNLTWTEKKRKWSMRHMFFPTVVIWMGTWACSSNFMVNKHQTHDLNSCYHLLWSRVNKTW